MCNISDHDLNYNKKILRFIEKKLDGPENFNIMPGNQMQVEKPEDMLVRTKNWMG